MRLGIQYYYAIFNPEMSCIEIVCEKTVLWFHFNICKNIADKTHCHIFNTFAYVESSKFEFR